MDYQSVLDFLYQKLPMFQRIGSLAYKKDLSNTLLLLEGLQNPHLKIKTIHIAGTNGKGSTSHGLAAIFQANGYKTGLYTSPHLIDFSERIKINNACISKDEIIEFVINNKKNIEAINPSFFEVTVAMAFHHFYTHHVDIAIIETGLGGRLDSTNVIHPLLSIITNISYDHQDLLGNTLAVIAKEKAGIIKSHTPIVIGETHEETESIFIDIAKSLDAPIYFADQNMNIKTMNIQSDLKGIYQSKNLRTIWQSFEILKNLDYKLDDYISLQSLSNIIPLTGLRGRWETLQTNPLVICDTGHNEAGIKEICTHIQNTKYKTLHLVLGFVKEKDIAKILSLFPKNAHFYFTQPDVPRKKPIQELKEEITDDLKHVKYFDLVSEAYLDALSNADENDFIFIGGSTFVVADLLIYLEKI